MKKNVSLHTVITLKHTEILSFKQIPSTNLARKVLLWHNLIFVVKLTKSKQGKKLQSL